LLFFLFPPLLFSFGSGLLLISLSLFLFFLGHFPSFFRLIAFDAFNLFSQFSFNRAQLRPVLNQYGLDFSIIFNILVDQVAIYLPIIFIPLNLISMNYSVIVMAARAYT